MGSAPDFKHRLCRLIHMLDLMSSNDGIRKDVLMDALGCSERTLYRDMKRVSEFFTISKTKEYDGTSRYHFERWDFDLDVVKKPISLKQLKQTVRTTEK